MSVGIKADLARNITIVSLRGIVTATDVSPSEFLRFCQLPVIEPML